MKAPDHWRGISSQDHPIYSEGFYLISVLQPARDSRYGRKTEALSTLRLDTVSDKSQVSGGVGEVHPRYGAKASLGSSNDGV